MKDETPLNLIIVERDHETAPRVEQICRDAGYTVTAQHATRPDELRDALRSRSWDLIVAGTRVAGISISQVIATVREQGSDAPVVGIVPPGDETSIGDALDAGARDAVVLNPPEHLVHVIKREIADLEDRRALKVYKSVLEQYEDRLLYFLGRAEKRRTQAPRGDPQASVEKDADLPATSPMEETMMADKTSEVIDTMANEMPTMAQDSRSAFFDELSTVLAEEPRRPDYQALLYITLKFAPTAALDAASTQAVLAAVEERLRGAATTTLISHHDGLSFVALISHRDRQGLVKAAYSIKHEIEKDCIHVEDRDIRTLCDIGACLADQHMRLPTRLIANAKAACEKAIAEGRRICFSGKATVAPKAKAAEPKSPSKAPVPAVPVAKASPVSAATEKHTPLSGTKPASASVPTTRVTAKDSWPVRIRAALDENRFKLVFQPVVHFHAPPTEAYEILLRMIDETGQEVMPGEFIPEAEKAGLMPDIDRWVAKTATSILLQRQVSGSSTRLFVKLSEASVECQDFPAWLRQMLKAVHLPAGSLVFELSESIVAKHRNRAGEYIKLLTAMGCGTSLGHFGLAEDSLETAKTLPVNYLKFDGRLIQNLARDKSSETRFKEIMDAARATQKVTIASFVQDPYILSILWRCQVDYVQGFYFQPPKPAMAYDFTSAMS